MLGLALSDPKVAGLTVKLDTLMVRPGQRAILSIPVERRRIQTPKTPITIVLNGAADESDDPDQSHFCRLTSEATAL
jgi:hypothetical protein